MKKGFFRTLFLLPVMILSACGADESPSAVSVQDLRTRLAKDEKTVVIDVRTAEELSGSLGRLDGVINIPLHELQQRIGELSKYKDRELHIICRSGNRSGKAATMLRESGYRALNVSGGMIAWRNTYSAANR